MEEFGIPSGKIYRTPEMLEDAHFRAREVIVTTKHPVFGDLKMQNVAPKLSATPGAIRTPAPELGENNEEIYRSVLNKSDADLAGLKERNVI